MPMLPEVKRVGDGGKLIGQPILLVVVDVGEAEVVDPHEVADLLRRGHLKLEPDDVRLLGHEPVPRRDLSIIISPFVGLSTQQFRK